MERDRIPIQKEILIPKELVPLVRENTERKKICVVMYPDKKYVPYVKHIIKEIKEVMNPYFEVKTLSEGVKPQGSNFQTVLELLKESVLGIVILDGLRPNVVLEYGILIGLKKPIICLKDKDAEIDIKNLDDSLTSSLEKANISNPKLDIDKHLSDVKDLHRTKYRWKDPENLKDTLEEELKKLMGDITSELKKSLSTPEIDRLKPDISEKFQELFSELAQYSINLIPSDYEKIKELDVNLHNLAKKYNIELSYKYYFEIGNVYLRTQKYNEALKSFDEAIKLKENFAEAWTEKGNVLINLNRYKEAIKCFDEVIKINPKDAVAWENKGIVLLKLEKYDEAIASFDEAIKMNPKDAEAWKNKGIALGSLEKYAEAVKCLDKAIKMNPKDAVAWAVKGITLLGLEKYAEAVKCLDKAIKMNPKDAVAHTIKGIALLELKKYDKAIASFDEAIKINPKDAEAWENKGVALGNLGKHKEAVKCFDKAIKINPKDADAWKNKGIALLKLEKYDEAIASFDEVIKINPKDAVAWYNKACLFSRKGDAENALEYLSEAISLDEKWKEEARKDEDFKNLWDDEEFIKITS